MATQQTIDSIIDRFDFHAVRAHMQRVGWTWAGYLDTPPLEALQRTAREVLQLAAHSGPSTHNRVSTGGFTAYRLVWESGDTELVLTFDAFEESRIIR